MSCTTADFRPRYQFARLFGKPRLHYTFGQCWRVVIVALLVALYVLGYWSGLITPAYAASLAQHAATRPFMPSQPASHAALSGYHSQQAPVKAHTTLAVSSSQPFDGLGDLPFYTYITYPIDDHLELKVNVANGNLVAHMSNLHLKGTGIDESIEGYYNSQASFSRDLGNNWNFNLGHDVRLDLSNPTAGITLYGPSGYSAFFAYNSSTGTYTDPPGLNSTLVFNGNNNTYTLTFHRTGEQLIFGSNSHLAAEKDKNGNTISYSYNSTHDLLSLTDSQGRVTTFTHNTALGSSHDPSGQITSLTDPAGRTVHYTYNERGNPANSLTSLTDVMGKTTTFDYSGGDLTTITDPLGNVTTISYLTGDKVGTITDATKQGQILFAYTSTNTVVTDRNGHNTTYNYDTNASHQFMISSVKDALGNSKSTQYDANFNVNTYSDALSDTTTYTYSQDGKNNLNAVQDGTLATTKYTYPTSGTSNLFYPLTQTDSQGHQANYAYDSNGNLMSALDNSNGMGLHYSYNPDGTVSKITQDVSSAPQIQNVTTFGYDSHGNLTTVTPPNTNGSTLKPYTFTVDANTSRVNSVTDGNNHQTTYTYDTFDRITTIGYAGGATITYTYDADGNLLSEVDNTGTTTFTYDALNRLRTKTLPGGTIIHSDYDKTGNLTSLNDGGGAVTYGYDAANRMTTLTTADGKQSVYTYDNADRKIMIQYPNLTGMKMTYDKAGHELTNIGGTMDSSGNILTTYDSFTYTYTSGSTHTALLQTVSLLDPVQHNATFLRTYTYDSQNRLTVDDVTQNGTEVQKLTWGYDAAGNRLSATMLSGGNVTYTYGGGNELLSKNDGTTTTTYSYDGNGNLLGSTGGPSYTYNTKNQTSNIGSDSFTYSGASQTDLVQINTDTAVYTGLGLSAYTDNGATSHYVRCSCGLLNHERAPNGNKYYYLFDGLGSIVGMTDSNGNEVNRYDYDPYGVMVNQQEQTGFTNLFKFAGGQYRSSTGLYKFGERYYDPNLGRWTQLDSAGTGYVYAGDDPVNAVDPSGKVEVYIEWGLGFFGLPIPTGVDIVFSSADIASLEGPGGAIIKDVVGAALSGAGVPGIIKDIIVAGINFQIAELAFFSNVFCGGNGVTIYWSILFSQIPTLRCPR